MAKNVLIHKDGIFKDVSEYKFEQTFKGLGYKLYEEPKAEKKPKAEQPKEDKVGE